MVNDLPDTSVTPGHTPGRHRPHGAIFRSGRGTNPPRGSAALGETPRTVKEDVPESAVLVDASSPNANPQTKEQ